jgi:hypothetical protein
MNCPFCTSEEVEVPTVDIGVGEQQCGPAACFECGASQDQDGKWVQYDAFRRIHYAGSRCPHGFGHNDVRIGRFVSFLCDGVETIGTVRSTDGPAVLVSVMGIVLMFRLRWSDGAWRVVTK